MPWRKENHLVANPAPAGATSRRRPFARGAQFDEERHRLRRQAGVGGSAFDLPGATKSTRGEERRGEEMKKKYVVFAVRYQDSRADIHTVGVSAQTADAAVRCLAENRCCLVLDVTPTEKDPQWAQERIEGYIDYDWSHREQVGPGEYPVG
jgi:hypothetical protein